MSEGQKIIKYIAVAFAIFLTLNIIIGIVSAINVGINILGSTLGMDVADKTYSGEEYFADEEYRNLTNIEIDSKVSNLTIKTGDKLKVETKNTLDKVEIKISGNTLKIKEKKKNIFINNTSEILVYIPETIEFHSTKIETGAGNVSISDLKTNTLELELGAGNVIIDNLNVRETSKIDGGVGEVKISNSLLNNLNLDVGVGNFIMQAKILGKNKIDSGIGNLNLILLGNEEEYRLYVEKGLGLLKIDGKNVESDKEYGNGDNIIKIDSGVGNVEIDYENE